MNSMFFGLSLHFFYEVMMGFFLLRKLKRLEREIFPQKKNRWSLERFSVSPNFGLGQMYNVNTDVKNGNVKLHDFHDFLQLAVCLVK